MEMQQCEETPGDEAVVIADFMSAIGHAQNRCEICGRGISSVWETIPLDPREDGWAPGRVMPHMIVCNDCTTGWVGEYMLCKWCSWRAGSVGSLVQHYNDNHELVFRVDRMTQIQAPETPSSNTDPRAVAAELATDLVHAGASALVMDVVDAQKVAIC